MYYFTRTLRVNLPTCWINRLYCRRLNLHFEQIIKDSRCVSHQGWNDCGLSTGHYRVANQTATRDPELRDSDGLASPASVFGRLWRSRTWIDAGQKVQQDRVNLSNVSMIKEWSTPNHQGFYLLGLRIEAPLEVTMWVSESVRGKKNFLVFFSFSVAKRVVVIKSIT